MARTSEKRRLEALALAIRRKQGGPDLSRLNAEQRDVYEDWYLEQRDLVATFVEPDEYYAATLEANYRERYPLRHDIRRMLFGDIPQITTNDSQDHAAEKYHRLWSD